MNDALFVSVVNGLGERRQGRSGNPRRLRLPVQKLRERPAIDELKREIGLSFVGADLVDLHDVGVLESRGRLRLRLEAGQQ